MTYIRNLLVIVLCLVAQVSFAQQKGYRIKNVESVEGKNYYFTSLIESTPALMSAVRSDKTLSAIASAKLKALGQASTFSDRIAAMQFSEDEITSAARALKALYASGNDWDRILEQDIRPSGCYAQYRETGGDLIARIWEQDARGMNRAVRIYAGGEKPNYPAVDSIGFDVRSPYFLKDILPDVQLNVLAIARKDGLFFSVPLQAVKTVLDVNDRCQVLDFEPMWEKCNLNAYSHIHEVNFADYPYTAILVLGAGPEDPREHISPGGRIRSAYAAMLWKDGKAPFIVVSGGRVHPYHTPYNEAEQMKRYLMDVCGIPENVIIMEPHARHTTNNIRNTARIMLRQGFPMDRKALITSSELHIDYILNPAFAVRCKTETGVVPFRFGKRLSRRVVEFYPEASSTIINPDEPLDP